MKITKKTTSQEIFDFVVTKLAEQGYQSRGPDICLYRGPHGRKCAAGWLIPDEDYVSVMERTGPTQSLLDTFPQLSYLEPFVHLIRDLQKAHDNALYDQDRKFIDIWNYNDGSFLNAGIAAKFEHVAKVHKLDMAVLLKVWPKDG